MRVAGIVIVACLALAAAAFGARDVSVSGNHLVDSNGKPMGLSGGGGGNAGRSSSAQRKSGTKVLCVSSKTSKRIYRKKPRACTFHKHGEPMAEAFFVRTKHDRWHRWHRGRAKGKGREVTSMGHSRPPVRIRLSHSVQRCGHRVFTKAHFFFPKSGHGSSMRLDACP